MVLPRSQVLAAAASAGIPIGRAELFAPDEVDGVLFGTVSRDWVSSQWQATVDSLPPPLIEVRQLGGGKTRRVPRYLLNGFCCRGAALKVYADGMMGFALQAASSPAPLDHDALAFGFLHYTAIPRAENGYRSGRHEQLWFIDHDGKFQTFEDGDGDSEPLIPQEFSSVTLFFAQ